MPPTESSSREAAILTRLAGPDDPALSPAAAEGLLALRFSRADCDRMNDLAAKARVGKLSGDEQADLEAYSRVNSLLGILHSKARRALKRRGSNGKANSDQSTHGTRARSVGLAACWPLLRILPDATALR